MSTFSVPVTLLGLALEPEGGSLAVGSTFALRARPLSGSAADYGPLRWTSSDTLVATVDSVGLVRGRGVGTARIAVVATTNPRVRVERTVTVLGGGFPISVAATPSTLALVPDAAAQITAFVSIPPSTQPDSLRGVTFTSTDTTVAAVSVAGVVVARRAGAATILVAPRIAPTVMTEVAVRVTAPPAGGPTVRLLPPLAGSPPRELPLDSLRGRVLFRALAPGAADEIGRAELWLGERLASAQPVRTRVAGGTEYLFEVDTGARDATGAPSWPDGRTVVRLQYELARGPGAWAGVVRDTVTLVNR